MYVIASFKQDKNLERALAELEYNGFSNQRILALPLDTRTEQIHYISNQKKLFLFTPIFGTILSLFGIIYGFVFVWGPIFWGLIGIALGLGIGFTIDFLSAKKSKQKYNQEQIFTEVFLMIHCSKDQVGKVKDILWSWYSLGVTTYENKKEMPY
ncbi:hypothetical protein [Alkalihalobacillus sp. BA299]|uniref:hypothetical protein n=1 Tax=Alkalihalobacillus sp. BA299 TaxID=2815938 RepID=UPI001ADB634B|nr:hypothetical protein [Alkalihalobacillus sp. BA299]